LQELAKQSYTAIFPSRTGKRKLSAWLEDTDVSFVFDESNVVRGSISNFTKTDLSKVYNDFFLQFNYNPGPDKHDRAFFVTRPDADRFPDISDPTWTQYVGGNLSNIDNSAYADCKELWTACHESWQYNKAIAHAPDAISKLNWFNDRFLLGATDGLGTDSSVFSYLTWLVYWATRQKNTVEFSVPLTTSTVELELLQSCSFSDAIYTNGVALQGWITKIEIDVTNSTDTENGPVLYPVINLAMILSKDVPTYPPNALTRIIERGVPLNDALQIVESGSQTDIYQETGVV
jgi:hypothetical protein